MTHPRFITSSLAAIAVAATITLAGPTAHAADQQCGVPGAPAVFETVQHEAVTEIVPAQTHQEWQWERLVEHYTYEWSKLLSPESVEVDWVRTVPGAVETRYSMKVIDVPYQEAVPTIPAVYDTITVIVEPAVTQTLLRYELRKPNKNGEGYTVQNEAWQPEGWGGTHGNNPESQWVQTEDSREQVITPAVTREDQVLVTPEIPGTPEVPEQSHLEYNWFASDPGGAWIPTAETRTLPSTTENQTTDGAMPAGDGWTEVTRRTTPAEYDTQWAAGSPGDGYARTGTAPQVSTTTETTTESSAEAPGEGWTRVANSEVTVTDVKETVRVVKEAWSEQVLVTPAVPATEPCTDKGGPATDEPQKDDQVAGEPQQDDDQVAGPQAAPPVASGVLPNTGNGASLPLAAAGLGSLAAGAVLMMRARRQRFDAN